ncbi:MAG: HPr kinase/phosphatase C-terminal domain-containing protein [Hyphomicrobiaceae bacterium]
MPERVHGTAVGIAGRAVLLRGPSGAGKSDLALRLIGAGSGTPWTEQPVRLVADDQVLITVEAGLLIASSPEPIQGLLEIRGVGVVEVPSVDRATLALVVDLVDRRAVPRLPEPDATILFGVRLPRLSLDAFSASTHLKVLAALAHHLNEPGKQATAPKPLASHRD